jgi:multicomponent Na+:H+ antiporter subunit D
MLITGVIFTTAGFALAGLPPFATFAGKAVVEQAASEMAREWLQWVFLLASALTGGTVLRAACTMFRGWGAANIFSLSAPASGDKEGAETKHPEKGTPWVMWLPALFLLLVAGVAGPAASIHSVCDYAAGQFVDTSGYRETVLLGLRGAEEQPPPHTGSVSETGKGMAGAALAIAIAAAALFSHRLPDSTLERIRSVATPFLDLARRLHSGQIGDYAAWFMAGSAILLLAALNLPL